MSLWKVSSCWSHLIVQGTARVDENLEYDIAHQCWVKTYPASGPIHPTKQLSCSSPWEDRANSQQRQAVGGDRRRICWMAVLLESYLRRRYRNGLVPYSASLIWLWSNQSQTSHQCVLCLTPARCTISCKIPCHTFCPFWSGIGYDFPGTVEHEYIYLSFQFQMKIYTNSKWLLRNIFLVF